MDEIDRAQERELLDRQLALDAHARHSASAASAPGTEHCVGCDEPIDARRRRALPHATRCVQCQVRWETYGE